VEGKDRGLASGDPGHEWSCQDALAREMQEALRDREEVAITRSVKTAELWIKDIEDSISATEIADAVALEGECQIAEVRVGPIRPGTNRLGTVWVRCPLITANRLVRKGHLRLWTRNRLELLPEADNVLPLSPGGARPSGLPRQRGQERPVLPVRSGWPSGQGLWGIT